MNIVTIPFTPTVVRATEARLERIYDAAKNGLKGDSLALAAGMTPKDYRALCEMDENAHLAALKGKADAELEHATLLAEASRQGDAKASLAILQNVHGWTAKQEVSVTSTHNINIRDLIAERLSRIEGNTYDAEP